MKPSLILLIPTIALGSGAPVIRQSNEVSAPRFRSYDQPRRADYTTLEARQPFKMPEPANYGTNRVSPYKEEATNSWLSFGTFTSVLTISPESERIWATNFTAVPEGKLLAVTVDFNRDRFGYLTFMAEPSAWPGPLLSTNTVVVSAAGDNVRQLVNEHFAALSPEWRASCFMNATERWTIDTTLRRETATFQWRGQSATLTNNTVLGSVTNRWKLKTDWEKVP